VSYLFGDFTNEWRINTTFVIKDAKFKTQI